MSSRTLIEGVEAVLSEARKSRSRRLKRAAIGMPDWAPSNNAANYFQQQENLLLRGRVRLAALVRANDHLFEPGLVSDDCVVVVAEDVDVDLQELEALADRIATLQGHDFEDPILQTLAKGIAPGSHWITGIRVPAQLRPPCDCFVSYTMANRDHSLPNDYITGRFFPVLTLPEEPDLAMIAPWEEWTPEFYEMWNYEPPKPTLGCGGLFGIVIIASGYLGAGMHLGNWTRFLLAGTLVEKFNRSPGSSWFFVGLNVVGVLCLWALYRKALKDPALELSDVVNRPWYEKISRFPLTDRIAFLVWILVYLTAVVLGLIFV